MKIYGNLAVIPQKKPSTRPVRRKVIRKKGLPVKEKLLYLGTVIVFVVLTSFVLSQQAQLAELNYEIQQKEKQVAQVETAMTDLEDEVKDLLKPERIKRMAESRGFSYDPERIRPPQN